MVRRRAPLGVPLAATFRQSPDLAFFVKERLACSTLRRESVILFTVLMFLRLRALVRA